MDTTIYLVIVAVLAAVIVSSLIDLVEFVSVYRHFREKPPGDFYDLTGSKGKVVSSFPVKDTPGNLYGRVTISGESWKAVLDDESSLLPEIGDVVTSINVDLPKLAVVVR